MVAHLCCVLFDSCQGVQEDEANNQRLISADTNALISNAVARRLMASVPGGEPSLRTVPAMEAVKRSIVDMTNENGTAAKRVKLDDEEL